MVGPSPASSKPVAERKSSQRTCVRSLRDNPALPLVVGYLSEQLEAHAADPEKVRAISDLLKRERFAAVPRPPGAERFDPDRATAPGKQLPDFHVNALGGHGSYSPTKLRGKLYLLEVWATWCAPCIEQMPKLHEAFATYGKTANPRLHILSISLDDDPDAVTEFRKKCRCLGSTRCPPGAKASVRLAFRSHHSQPLAGR